MSDEERERESGTKIIPMKEMKNNTPIDVIKLNRIAQMTDIVHRATDFQNSTSTRNHSANNPLSPRIHTAYSTPHAHQPATS